ncbi:hydrogenase maturation nickel metallochaperone HypA [Olsenella sp. YH-ols2217]|uniref:Hydrogenase maturation factor HypA n=1 Tax=Kribbibacterium absianum TaxID=3044210 RepID=A0ABT6ZI46_9ACTN|nr:MULTISPECIES: hydrogenase maturation nickel metallochaperone HypA [unclassified Olsenella]MDJ1121224.1 hydrogenase maturation nickel metallochaperone HypA [Olsenella sp. YH-ols2216]MDJ1128714.1 hydrogenase maturation nickel metallochaperone HypA [Olsenella sp. YH-ols2217]
MHELGVVFYIIDAVTETAEANGVGHVDRVSLEVGEATGIVPDLFQEAWRWAADRTDLLRGAALSSVSVPAMNRCRACGLEYPAFPAGPTCPSCGSGDTVLAAGDDVTIVSIEVT